MRFVLDKIKTAWQYVPYLGTRPSSIPVRESIKLVEPTIDPILLSELEDLAKHGKLLFHYGNGVNNPLSPAFTVEKLSLWNYKEAGIPLALKGGFNEEELPGIVKAKISGNLFLVESLDELDKCLKNGLYFNRKMVHLIIPQLNSEGFPARITAWMYLGDNSWKPQIEWDANFYRSGGGHRFCLAKMVEDPRRWLGQYYEFTPEDFKEGKCFVYLHKHLNEHQQTDSKGAVSGM